MKNTTGALSISERGFSNTFTSLSVVDADIGWLAYTQGESFLAHREHCGVPKSHDNLDFAQASQDRRSVLRIVCMEVHNSNVRIREARNQRIAQ